MNATGVEPPMPAPRLRAIKNPLFWLILLLAGALRLAGLNQEGYWLDEIMQVSLAQVRGLHGFLARVPLDKPPLTYLELYVLAPLSLAELLLRLPSLLAGVASVALVMLLARRHLPRSRAAVALAGLIVAISPLAVQLSRQVLPYAQGAAFVLAAWLSALCWRESGRWRWLVATGLSCTLALWSVYQSLTSLIVLGLAAGGWLVAGMHADWQGRKQGRAPNRAPWIRPAMLLAVLGLSALSLALLWKSIAALLSVRVPWVAPPLGWATLSGCLQTLAAGYDGARPNRVWMLLALLAGIQVLLILRHPRRSGAQGLLVLWLVGGLALLHLLAWRQQHWIPARYLIFYLPPLAVLAGAGGAAVAALGRRPWQRHVLGSLLALVLALGIWPTLWGSFRSYPDYRGLARQLAAQARPGDLALFQHRYDEYCYTFYQQNLIRNAPPATSYQQTTPEDLYPPAPALVRQARRLWVVEMIYGAYPWTPAAERFFLNGKPNPLPPAPIPSRLDQPARALDALYPAEPKPGA